MTVYLYIILTLVVLILLMRYFTKKMYAIKRTRHTDTPEKFGIAFEEISIPTENDKQLYAWWIPAARDTKTAPTLILVHGWSRNLGRMLRYIQNLHPLNYNLLAFDARHHGSSDQDDHASMYKFGRDVMAVVNNVKTRPINLEKIGVVGLSLGGAGSTYAAALEPAIKAVVTVGAPAHPVDIMSHEFKKHRLPAPIIWLILKQVEMKIGVPYKQFAPETNISKAAATFLIIHGDQDEVVPPSQGEKLAGAARPEQAELWSIPGRRHSNCHHEPEFWDRVHKFFQSQLAKG